MMARNGTARGTATSRADARVSVLVTAVFLGIGLIGAMDEIVFHQLLQWHNFYVHTSESWRVFSDGLFHVFTATLLFLGALRLWRQRRQIGAVTRERPFWAGILLGAGGFQLFDGTVNHKLLMLHPVREGVASQLPYDLAWNGLALVMLAAGWLLWRGLRPDPVGADTRSDDLVGVRR